MLSQDSSAATSLSEESSALEEERYAALRSHSLWFVGVVDAFDAFEPVVLLPFLHYSDRPFHYCYRYSSVEPAQEAEERSQAEVDQASR